MYFSAAATDDGIIEEINRICGVNDNNYSLLAKTARVNQALDRFTSIALVSDGRWTFDDLNKGDLPIGTADLEDEQQDYEFADEILAVQKVLVKDSAGVWKEIVSADIGHPDTKNIFKEDSANVGVPIRYTKFAHSILLDPVPNYDSSGGLKVVFKRNVVKFVSTDTDTECGIPSIFHPYIARMASLPYVAKYGTSQELANLKMLIGSNEPRSRYYGGDEQLIVKYFAIRGSDTRNIIKPRIPMGR